MIVAENPVSVGAQVDTSRRVLGTATEIAMEKKPLFGWGFIREVALGVAIAVTTEMVLRFVRGRER